MDKRGNPSLQCARYQCYNLGVKVYVKLIATYREHLPPGTNGNIAEVDVADSSTVRTILTPFGIPLDDSSVIVVNGLSVPLDTLVNEGDTVAAFSAIAGG
ncbi:MAG: MoaD/ThiS family protein [Anaerolineales bacterium]